MSPPAGAALHFRDSPMPGKNFYIYNKAESKKSKKMSPFSFIRMRMKYVLFLSAGLPLTFEGPRARVQQRPMDRMSKYLNIINQKNKPLVLILFYFPALTNTSSQWPGRPHWDFEFSGSSEHYAGTWKCRETWPLHSDPPLALASSLPWICLSCEEPSCAGVDTRVCRPQLCSHWKEHAIPSGHPSGQRVYTSVRQTAHLWKEKPREAAHRVLLMDSGVSGKKNPRPPNPDTRKLVWKVVHEVCIRTTLLAPQTLRPVEGPFKAVPLKVWS